MTDFQLATQLERLTARWLVGTAAPLSRDMLPSAWTGDVDAVDELACLALATQARQFLFRPALPAYAQASTPLPLPSLALLPETLRVLFRRAHATLPPSLFGALLTLMAARGYIAHPFDWMPAPGNDPLPAAYDAWRAWSSRGEVAVQEEFDPADWNDLPPAGRRTLLQRMRAQNPQAARVFLAARLGVLPAEQRLQLVDQLETGLSQDDDEFLAGLAGDRSEKVRQRATQLRWRLGHGAALDQTERNELRAWFSLGREGVFNRRTRVRFAKLKSAAQERQREARLRSIGWTELAAALDCTPMELADAIVFAAPDDNLALLDCAIGTGPDDVLLRLVETLLFEQTDPLPGMPWSVLLRRVPTPVRAELAHRTLRESARFEHFTQLLEVAGGALPALSAHELQRSRLYVALLAEARRALGEGIDLAGTPLAYQIAALGCLLPQSLAGVVIDALAGLGLHALSSVFDVLRINQQLSPSSLLDQPR